MGVRPRAWGHGGVKMVGGERWIQRSMCPPALPSLFVSASGSRPPRPRDRHFTDTQPPDRRSRICETLLLTTTISPSSRPTPYVAVPTSLHRPPPPRRRCTPQPPPPTHESKRRLRTASMSVRPGVIVRTSHRHSPALAASTTPLATTSTVLVRVPRHRALVAQARGPGPTSRAWPQRWSASVNGSATAPFADDEEKGTPAFTLHRDARALATLGVAAPLQDGLARRGPALVRLAAADLDGARRVRVGVMPHDNHDGLVVRREHGRGAPRRPVLSSTPEPCSPRLPRDGRPTESPGTRIPRQARCSRRCKTFCFAHHHHGARSRFNLPSRPNNEPATPQHDEDENDDGPSPRTPAAGDEDIAVPDFYPGDIGDTLCPAQAEAALRDLMESDSNADTEIEINPEDAIVPGFREGIVLMPHHILGRTWMRDREDDFADAGAAPGSGAKAFREYYLSTLPARRAFPSLGPTQRACT
ncbi:hypothetical protein C8R47DRAFT_1223492 [Mycena vitilis]|nr:hypothetical protein C8R47DRAFT_1223492 [Mycena vitilis]